MHLVGHSFGGYLSLRLALREPTLVATLTVIGAGPGFRDPGKRAVFNDRIRSLASTLAHPGVAELGCQRDSEVLDRLPELQPPFLVVVGERDGVAAGGAERFASDVPGARVVTLPGGGHNVHRSHPAEVAELIAQHVQGAA